MEAIVLAGVVLNLLITGVLLFRIDAVRKSVHEIKVIYFTDVSDVTGFIKNANELRF